MQYIFSLSVYYFLTSLDQECHKKKMQVTICVVEAKNESSFLKYMVLDCI